MRYVKVPRELFIKYITNRVRKRNKNFLSLCTGIPGEGKSYSMLRLAEEVDPDFNVDRVILTVQELMKVIRSKSIGRGNAMVVDEFGVMHNARAFQSTDNRMINFLMQTFRRQGFIMLGCAPSMALIDKATRNLLHCHFITNGIDVKKKVCNIKPMFLQPSQTEDKVYRKYLRIGGLLPNRKLVALEQVGMPLPSKELRRDYEKKRDEFQDEINEMIEKALNKENRPKKSAAERLTPLLQQTLMDWHLGLSREQCAQKHECDIRAIDARRKRLSELGYSKNTLNNNQKP